MKKSLDFRLNFERIANTAAVASQSASMGSSNSTPGVIGEVRRRAGHVKNKYHIFPQEILVHSFLLDADYDTCQMPWICPRKNVTRFVLQLFIINPNT